MERYESLGLVGEGSYGTVLKCRHRDSGRLVAIKKFVDSDDDKTVKKIALREIKLLRQLRHDNLVNLLEVWKRRRRWYLVFEFVERTLLDDLEQNPSGLDPDTSRQHLYQVLRAAAFCHQQNIIHRDIKPENILISQGGVVKMCDFGFARTVASSCEDAVYTDYVATRWYRAPELLVGDTQYGKPVDVWAVGCLLLEMLTGQPLFPGDSDLDQIYHIVRCFGNLTAHHQDLFYRNPVFSGVRLTECSGRIRLEQRFVTIPPAALDLAQSCLQMDPERRAQCSELQEHLLFTQDSFHIRFLDELNAKIQKDHRENSTLPKIPKNLRRERNDGDDKNKNRRSKDRKPPEDMGEKVNKETKVKQRLSRTLHDASEPSTSIKPSKTDPGKSKPGTETETPKTTDSTDPKDVDTSTDETKPELREEPKLSRSSTTDPPNDSASPRDLLKICAERSEAASASKTSTSDPLTPSGRRPNMDKEPRKTSECPAVLPSNPKPTKATSNFSPKMKNNHSKTSDLNSSPAAQPKGALRLSKTSSSSHPKPTKDTAGVPRKLPGVLPTDGGLPEEPIAAGTPRSNKDFKEEEGGLKTSPTAADLTEVSEAPGFSESCRVHQYRESKTTCSDEENSASVQSSTSKEPIVKPLRPTLFRSLIGEPKTKAGSTKTTSLSSTVKKSRFPPETRKKRENPEKKDVVKKSASDRKASPPSSPPPPPPPPSSTPLLFIGSPPSEHLSLGSGVHPGPHGLRCVDTSKRHGGFSSRPSDVIAGPQAAPVPEKNAIGERHFLSDRCKHSGGVATTKKKPDVHFPDLRSSVLPELRGKEGKHNKGITKDQRKDKQAAPPSEPHGHSSTQQYTVVHSSTQ